MGIHAVPELIWWCWWGSISVTFPQTKKSHIRSVECQDRNNFLHCTENIHFRTITFGLHSRIPPPPSYLDFVTVHLVIEHRQEVNSFHPNVKNSVGRKRRNTHSCLYYGFRLSHRPRIFQTVAWGMPNSWLALGLEDFCGPSAKVYNTWSFRAFPFTLTSRVLKLSTQQE